MDRLKYHDLFWEIHMHIKRKVTYLALSVKIVAIRLREFARLQSDCHSHFGHAMAVSQHE